VFEYDYVEILEYEIKKLERKRKKQKKRETSKQRRLRKCREDFSIFFTNMYIIRIC